VRDEALRWYGGPYDPDEIGEVKIIADLRKAKRNSTKRPSSD
jgi:hypothetical protein